MATSTKTLINAVVARLSGNLPTLVAAEGLPPITEFLNYDPGLPSPTKAPQVWVDMSRDRRSDDPRRGASINKYSRQMDVLIGVTIAGANAAEAADRHRDYVDLIVKCMEGDVTVAGAAFWFTWQNTDYSPNFGQGFALFREAVLHFDGNKRRAHGEA